MPTEDELAQQSRFAFTGTVQRLGAATMPGVPVTDNTAIVRVNSVLHAPEALGDWTGRDITVQLADGDALHEGQQAVFYTNPWLYGDSIAAQSMGHRSIEAGDAAQVRADRDLREHVDSADLVISGRVTAVTLPPAPAGRALAGAAGPRRWSEHDPKWHQAVVHIESVEKGSHPEPDAVVNFPSSTDVAWYRAPKFHPGDEGVFILHTRGPNEPARPLAAAGPAAVAPAAGTEAYTVLHPQDFQPRQKLTQVRSFVGGAP